MADIIVSVPKKEVEHFWDQVPPDAVEWWTLPRRPKRLLVGDSIHFALDGRIVARAKVSVIRHDERVCEATGRKWSGCHVVWKATDFQEVIHPTVHTSVRRGFAYREPV